LDRSCLWRRDVWEEEMEREDREIVLLRVLNDVGKMMKTTILGILEGILRLGE
jgi:hypothetical protein